MDVHKKESQICILAEGGELIERRVRTEPERFAAVLGDRPRARILLETSTESEWVARCLEALGHEVIVADPNLAPMYATCTRKVKADRRDARARADRARAMTHVEVGSPKREELVDALLTLVRHGQTEDNAAGRWEGMRDSPLTAEGCRQVEALAARLKPDGPYVVLYTSRLGRATQTAEVLAPLLGDPAVRRETDLREYDFGGWDGLTPAELRARGFWQEVTRDPEFTPPGGEPFGAAARRVEGALRAIASRHRGGRAVVVGHGLTLAAALARLLDGDPRQAPRYALANGGVAKLAMNGRPRLVHLDPPIS